MTNQNGYLHFSKSNLELIKYNFHLLKSLFGNNFLIRVKEFDKVTLLNFVNKN